MRTKTTTINVPIVGLKPLYRDDKKRTLVCEIDVDELKKVNEPKTLEEAIARAELDYSAGNYKSFKNPRDLMKYLKS